MCEFCENPTKWNTDDYSLVPNRNLSDGVMQAEDNTYQIGMFDSLIVGKLWISTIALSAEESWWKNDIVQNSIVYLLSLIVMVHKEIQKY